MWCAMAGLRFGVCLRLRLVVTLQGLGPAGVLMAVMMLSETCPGLGPLGLASLLVWMVRRRGRPGV